MPQSSRSGVCKSADKDCNGVVFFTKWNVNKLADEKTTPNLLKTVSNKFDFFVSGTLFAKSLFLTRKVDTIKVEISPTVFIANDSSYNCYIIKSEHLFLVDTNLLVSYLGDQSNYLLHKKDSIFQKEYFISSEIDTLKQVVKTNSDYISGAEYLAGDFGKSLLWYDLQSAYVFNLFKESYSDRYTYLASVSMVKRSDFKYYDNWFYTLIKVDLSQNNNSNFYFNTKSVSWSTDESVSDSIMISDRKMDKIKENIELLAIYKGAVAPIEDNNTINILFSNSKRYILESSFTPLNKEGAYSIGIIKKYARKYFEIPYFEKK